MKFIFLLSRIPDEMRVVKPSLTRTADEDGFLNPETNIWNTVILPKKYPDSRDDVFILDNWIDNYLQNPRLLRAAVKGSDVESASQIARQQLLVLDLGQSEVVRQVSMHCYERGQLMNKLWSNNKELYETVIKEQQEVIQALHRRVMDGNYHTEQIHQQMELMKRDFDDQIKALYRTSNLGQREEELAAFRTMQTDMIQMERDIKIMESTVSDLGFWFPNFFSYSTSILRRLLPPVIHTEKVDDDQKENLINNLPQKKLFEDLKRLEKLEMGINILLNDGQSASGIGSSKGNTHDNTIDVSSVSIMSEQASSLQVIKRGDANHVPSVIKRKRTIMPSSTQMTMKDLVYENQIQNIALKELETKLKQLEFRSSQREAEMKEKIGYLLYMICIFVFEFMISIIFLNYFLWLTIIISSAILQQQCRNLSDMMPGSAAANTAGTDHSSASAYSAVGPQIVLSRPFPSLAPAVSIADELVSLARGLSVHQGGAVDSKSMHLISIAEIQRVFQSFFSRFVTGMLPSNVIGVGSGSDINDARFNHVGRAPHSRLSHMDFCLGSLESFIISQWGMQAKLSIRQSRERLRSLMWSVLSWLQSSNQSQSSVYKGNNRQSIKSGSSRICTEDTLVIVLQHEDLPRYPEEHEKSLLRVLSMLLGIRYHKPVTAAPPAVNITISESLNDIIETPSAATPEAGVIRTASDIQDQDLGEPSSHDRAAGVNNTQISLQPKIQKLLPGPRYPLRDQIFSQLFIRCFQTMQV